MFLKTMLLDNWLNRLCNLPPRLATEPRTTPDASEVAVPVLWSLIMSKFINTVGGRRGRIDKIPDLNLFERKSCTRKNEVFGKFLEDEDNEVRKIQSDSDARTDSRAPTVARKQSRVRKRDPWTRSDNLFGKFLEDDGDKVRNIHQRICDPAVAETSKLGGCARY